MKTVIYVDMLFLINFFINMVLLKITLAFTKRKSSTMRYICSSVIGALYAVCMFFPQIKAFYIFPFKLLMSVLMVHIVYTKRSLSELIKGTFIFYLVSFTFAGVMLALIYFTNFAADSAPVVSNGIFYFNISLKTLIITSVIVYILISAASKVFQRSRALGVRKLTICLGENSCEIQALPDTGNLLTDPITHTPVIIAEKPHLETLFPEGIPTVEQCTCGDVKLRIIPYSSLGNSEGIMTGFVPDAISIDGLGIKNAIIGICDSTLSEKDEYNALFNPNILKS